MAKLRRFFTHRGIRLPSREAIRTKEKEIMVDYEITEAIGNSFCRFVWFFFHEYWQCAHPNYLFERILYRKFDICVDCLHEYW